MLTRSTPGRLMTATSPAQIPSRQLIAWRSATWQEYTRIRDSYEHSDVSRVKLFYYNGALLVDDMGWEGINHATVRELFLLMLGFWFNQNPQKKVKFMGGCLLEKEGEDAASPDLMLYLGADAPICEEGESRKIDLGRWRAPDLVGEISDTTLASDLDQKKKLYAALGIAEYWVVDVRGSQVFFFCLNDQGQYQETQLSTALLGLSYVLLEQALSKLSPVTTNMDVANWFQQQIAKDL